MITPSFLEDHISQVPALQLLVKLGYTYLRPEEALEIGVRHRLRPQNGTRPKC